MRRIEPYLPALAGLAILVGMVNFFATAAIHGRVGSALDGKVDGGRYYVSDHGSLREIARETWELIRIQEMSVYVTHPLAILAGVYAANQIAGAQMYRAPRQVVSRSVAEVRASGLPLDSLDCWVRLGGTSIPNSSRGISLSLVEVYPGGLVVNINMLPGIAIRATEITALREGRSWSDRGVDVVHTSREVASPLRLGCEWDEEFCAALERMAGRTIAGA